MKKNLSKRLLSTISIMIILSMIVASLTHISNGYSAKQLSEMKPSDFFNVKVSDLLYKTLGADGEGYEKNILCVEHNVGTYLSHSGGWVGKVIDINFDGPNTVKVDGANKSITDATTLKYFNALAYSTAHSTSKAYKDATYGRGGAPWKAAVAYFCNSGELEPYTGLGGDYGSSAYLDNQAVKDKVAEAKKAGKKVAAYNNSEIKSKDGSKTPECTISGGKAYLGPFRYSTSDGKKVNFTSVEIVGEVDGGKNIEKTIKKPGDHLFTKTSGGFKSVSGIGPDKDFYIQTNKDIDDAMKIKVKINVEGPKYYKSRILFYKGGGVQTYTIYSCGNGEETSSSKSIEFEFDNNRGNLEINKKGIYAGQTVNKVQDMGFRVYREVSGSKKYLNLNGKSTASGTIKITEQKDTNQSGATVVYTNSNGKTTLKGIDSRYQYYLEEVTDKSDFSSKIISATQKIGSESETELNFDKDKGILGPITVKKKSQATKTKIVVKDTRKTGDLQLIKEDLEATNKKVAEVKFKMKNKETDCWIVATGSDGVYNLKTYENDYSSDKDYYKANYTSDENKATEFETNSNGEIMIKGVDIGKYVIKEIYVKNDNGTKNYGYTEIDKPSNIDANYVFWSTDGGKTKTSLASKPIQLNVESSEKTPQSTIYIYDKKKYVKIRGYVWEDIDPYSKDNDIRKGTENLYDKDIDTLVDGIAVRLKDKKGNIVKTYDIEKGKWVDEVTTKNGGVYEFAEISREILESGEYHVEFEYNGLTYTSVIPASGDELYGKDRAINSKAKENKTQRENLNAAFTEVTNNGDITDRNHGQTKDSKDSANAKTTGTLTYRNNVENWQSIYESWEASDKSGAVANTNITANTDDAKYYLTEEIKKNGYSKDNADDSFVVENVNLGIVKREQPKLSVSGDISSVQVAVNGYWHKYDYEQRRKYVENNTAFNVGVKFGRDDDKYEETKEYYRAIYPSDVEYNVEEKGNNKLRVYVTYVTTIRNETTSLLSTANELVNYHDKDYSIVVEQPEGATEKMPDMTSYYIGKDGKKHAITWSSTSKYGQAYDKNIDDKYEGAYTTGLSEERIDAGQIIKVYTTFQVSDEGILQKLLTDLNGSAILDNATEIYAYSTYYGIDKEERKAGDIYAGVDQVSAPGNAKPGETSTYEADTDKAPALKLEAKGVRELEGTVFEDETERDLQSEQERKGDGIYNNGENTAAGVKVELVKPDGSPVTIYPPAEDDNDEDGIITAQEGTEAIAYTKDSNGNLLSTENRTGLTGKDGYYIFRGIEPDEYLIKYTYKNGTTKIFDTNGNQVKDITVQGYKSTVITSKAIEDAFENNNDHMDWYKTTEFEKDENGNLVRHSDARDEYDAQRQAIDNQLTDINEVKQLALEASVDSSKLDGITDTTVREQVSQALAELIKELDAKTPKFTVEVEKESVYSASTGDSYVAKTSNIDFGIAERPRQEATLNKTVSHISITSPSGNPLVEGDVDVANKKTPEHVTLAGDKLYITIDSEYLYGSKVEIKYKLTLNNTGELDYRNKTYYNYGRDNSNPVKLSSSTLIDYVDSELVLQEGQAGDGKTWSVTDLAREGLTLSAEQKEALLKQYSTVVTAEALPGDKEIAPGETNSTDIVTERLLSTKDNELTYNNNGEVVTIKKNGGSIMTSKLGSYGELLIGNLEADPKEPDEAKAEIVSIIPPTGSTDNTVTYVIIGTASLVVLGAGTYFIRRIVKK